MLTKRPFKKILARAALLNRDMAVLVKEMEADLDRLQQQIEKPQPILAHNKQALRR